MGNFIEINGQNAFIRVNTDKFNVCPEGDVRIIVPVGIPGGGGTTYADFIGFMATYNAALLPFLTNQAAFNSLGLGKEYIAGQGNTEAAQGTKMITYTP